jgi:Tfp pilus assembly protein PilV
VVIAVGLVAFVLTAILGLVAIAANETKNADLKARLAWITEQVTSEYQSQRFSNALASVPGTNYWDYSGMPTNAAGAYFVCDVSNVTPTNPTNANYPTNYIALLQLRTRWPSPQLTSTNVSVISLFNYQ